MAAITFTPTTWVDDTTPAITAAQLNRIESGIDDIINGGGDLSLSTNALTVGNVTSSGVVTIAAGAVGTPSVAFSGDSDTGIYRVAANELGVTAGGTFQFKTGDGTNGGLRAATGSVSVPGYGFNNDADTGMYRVSANVLGLTAGGTQVFQANGTNTWMLPVYSVTTATAANMTIDSGGQIRRSTSALKYKTDVKSLTSVPYLRAVSYTSKIDGGTHYGLIADEVADVLPDAAVYGPDGEVEDYDTKALIGYLLARINRLEGAA